MSHLELPDGGLLGYNDVTLSVSTPKTIPVLPERTDGQSVSHVLVQSQKGPTRVRFDGGIPNTNSGFILATNEAVQLPAATAATATWLADSLTAPLLSVTYFA